MLADKTVVLGVTGGIAAYKAADLASKLTQAGATVNVIMTEASTEFVAPLTFRAIPHRPVVTGMSDLSSQTVEKLTEVYPPYYLVQNPVDVTGSATSRDYRMGIEALIADPHIDLIMPWFVFQDTPLDEGIVEALADLSRTSSKPILCGAMGGPYTKEMSKAIEARGIPLFGGVRQWLAAARALSHQANRERR